MITDAIISWFQQIISFIVNMIPSAPIISAGNGAASGTACCATFLIGSLFSIVGSVLPGGTSTLTNTPLAILIDWGTLGFAVGCAFAFIIAFFIIKMLIQFWMMVKW